jgi:hypothetical protein
MLEYNRNLNNFKAKKQNKNIIHINKDYDLVFIYV